ncbi:MAG: DUF3313 domain-containing protein [Colwellia sp.]|nr:DUF3313 domain-containing protein [Colwellia sp.]
MFALAATAILVVGCQSTTDAPQVSQDGLQLKVNKRSTVAYKKEGVNFAEYNKIQIMPSQVAFKKKWKRDYNRSQSSLSTRIKDEDVLSIKAGVAKLFDEVFKEEFAKNNENVLVDTVSSGTLLIKPAIINLEVNAPDIKSSANVRTYVNEAGQATLFLELYDGISGEILARIIDTEIVGDNSYSTWANRVTNTADAKRTIRKWAKALRTKYEQAQGR